MNCFSEQPSVVGTLMTPNVQVRRMQQREGEKLAHRHRAIVGELGFKARQSGSNTPHPLDKQNNQARQIDK